LVAKRKDPDADSEKLTTGKQHRALGGVDMLAKLDDQRHLAIKSLLKSVPVGVDDKLATLKTAHHVDKDRFQSAFRSLMGTFKS
jgi:hypothetical protein